MSGAIFETYVLAELLKSYCHKGLQPVLYYYRDKDRKEIDFLIEQNQKLYPIEVKKAGVPKKDWMKSFSTLQKLKKDISNGDIVSMVERIFPIDDSNDAVLIAIL